MNRIGKIAVCLAGALACGITLHADGPVALKTAAGDPYTPIVERNIFGLLPPPAPPDPNAAVVADLPKITASGIMNVFGNLQVLFKTSAKPGSKDNYYDLAEGQSEDGIEVMKIDDHAGTVTFRNNGTEQQIALVTETSSGGGGGGGGGGSGGGMQGGFNGSRGGFGGRFGGGGAQNGFNATRQGGNPGYPGGYPSQNGGNNGNNGFNNGTGNNGGFSGGYSGQNGGMNIGNTSLNFNGQGSSGQVRSTTTVSEPAMPPEQQAVLIEVNRQINQQAVMNGDMPPLPPTEITPPDATTVGGAPLGGVERDGGNN